MSNEIADSAVGAILEIPPQAISKIKEAENAINKLKMTSAEAAGSVNLHWGEVATNGLGKFIQKITEANEALRNLGGSTADVKLNTESAIQQMSNFTEKVQSDSSKVSQSLQEIASTPIDAKGVKEYAETWNLTFQDVQEKIKALRNGLKVQTTEGQGAQVQLQVIRAWEDYYKSVSKVNEETNRHNRIVGELRTKINETQQAIDNENAVIARFSQKVQDAWTAVNAFKTANPNFNVDKAEQQLESLRGKIQRLYEQLEGGGLSEKKENRIVREIEQFKQQFATLDNTIATARRVYRELAEAEDTYESRANNSTRIIGQKNAELSSLTAKLGKAEQAQALFNAELEKGNTAKSLASEYAKLTKRLQEVNDAMNKFQSAGGNVNSASFQALQNEWQNIMARRKEIEKMDIAEVNQYRNQMNQAAYQQDLSAWVQAEAQKTAEAKKQADIQSNARKEAYQKYLNTYWGAIEAANKLGTRGGNYADTFENRARVIKNLETALKNLKTTDADYEKKVESLTYWLNRLREAQKKVTDAMKPTKPQVTLADANQARKIAEQTKTLKDYETAYKMLIEVMKQTPQGRAWDAMNRKAQEMKTHIDEIKKKMGELQSQASKTSNIMGQLQGRIAAAFSIGAINGFIKKMVEVRAQFELQRVALGAIIQDRDEANKIFTQVQNMALESPFSIMQLERATKQIAAFGFEAKKLVPTMKMFADISAGLGVEIDRLVLVMGHLKARNFLEGTMVRQFTNMGFNVLQNLADYYTKLENKMVSVGEVQDRVKKKMVSFADVEEVLKRVTSAGGMFYDMQKKQSDSLWGQMQRIKDAYDLMLNEIGQSNESSIKGALTLIRTLINHWRALAPIIKATGAAIAIYFAVSRFSAIAAGVGGVVQAFRNMTTVIWGTKAAQDALNASQKANAWGLVASLIAAAVVAIYEYATAQSKLNESMDRVRNDGIGNMYDLIYQYQKLADTVRNTNKPYEEQKKALEEIKRIYGEILPDEMLEIENIKQMSAGYEKATEAIKAYSAEKIKSNLKAEIENIVGKDIQSEENELADWMATLLDLWDKLPEKMPKDTFRSIAKTMIAEISEEVKNGSLPAEKAVDELKSRMVARLNKVMPKGALDDLFKYLDGAGHWFDSTYWDDYMSTLAKFKNMTDGIDIGFEGAESDNLVEVKKNYENLTNAVDEYKKAIEALRLAKEEGQVKGELSLLDDGTFVMETDKNQGYEALENLSQAYVKLIAQVGRYNATWNTTSKDINAAIESQTGQMAYFEQTNENVFGRILSGFSRWQERFRKDDSVKAWVENAEKEKDKLDLSDVQNKILGVALSVTSANGMQVKSLDKLRLASLNSFGDAAKAAQSVYNQLAQNEIAIQTQIKSLVQYGYTAAQAKSLAEAEFGAGMTVEEIKEMMKLYKELIPAFGGTFKDQNKSKSKKTSDEELKRWQDLKKAIEDVSTAYDKYRKSFTVAESNKRIEELYGPVFKELNSDIKQFYKDGKYDAESLVKALEVLKGLTNATTKEREKFRSEIERKIGVTKVEIEVKMSADAEKKLKADLDEMFANYELTEELKKIGVSVDLTYMVGGKPTTKEDIRKEIERLRKEGGGSADAENRIKTLEEAEKKLTQIELKEQKERLKNYEKYLKQMYSDRAKKMIEAYTDMKNMEQDFNSFIAKLQAEANQDGTTDERKQQIAEQIKSLKFQKAEAIKAVNEALNQNLAKLDWEQFKGSDVFTQLYQDTENLSKKGIDLLIKKLEDARTALQSMEKVDYRAVREITNHIQKLQDVRLETGSWKELNAIIKEAKETIGNVTLEDAQKNMVDAQSKIDAANIEIAQIQAIIDLKEQEGNKDDKIKNLSEEQRDLYDEDIDALRDKLATQQDIVKEQQAEVDKNEKIVDSYDTQRNAIKKKIAIVDQLKQEFDKVYQSVVDVADALGNDTDMWADFGQAIIDSTFSCITLTLQMQLMGIAANSALGIIGWIATALQVVANLFVSIFRQHDKRLEKQITRVQDRVDTLSKSFEKLEKSIERAFTIGNENRLTEQALDNLDEQRKAYEEMIRLEEAKKKTDDDKIKEYKDKLEELAEAEQELYEKRHEKYGSTNDVWDEANNWVDAWLDAYKETGDGLDTLNDSWDEFYENLVKKQATSKVLGSRMDKYIQDINKAIDKNMSEYGYVDAFKEIGERFKKEFGDLNQGLIDFFNYAGIGNGTGELILSDLQKGIQNITEPQAATIEAYLNSMRFAVFRHTEQLDTLIATIQMQYGSGAENPVVTELKGIRGVLDNIYRDLHSVVKSGVGKTYIQVG